MGLGPVDEVGRDRSVLLFPTASGMNGLPRTARTTLLYSNCFLNYVIVAVMQCAAGWSERLAVDYGVNHSRTAGLLSPSYPGACKTS